MGFSLTGGHDESNHHYSYSYECMMGWTGQTLGSSNKKRYNDNGCDYNDSDFEIMHALSHDDHNPNMMMIMVKTLNGR